VLPRGVSAQVGGVNPIERTHSGRPVSYSNLSMYKEEPVVLEVIVIWSSCKVCSRLSSARSTSSFSGTVVDIVLLSSSTLTLPPIEPPVKVQDVPGRVQRSDRGLRMTTKTRRRTKELDVHRRVDGGRAARCRVPASVCMLRRWPAPSSSRPIREHNGPPVWFIHDWRKSHSDISGLVCDLHLRDDK